MKEVIRAINPENLPQMIYQNIEELILDDIYFKAHQYYNDIDIYIKLEEFNAAGSIKLKPAKYMIEQAEKKGILNAQSHLIESSSGNLGVAMSHICASKGYAFTCVTDIKASQQNIKIMQALGAEVIIIDQLDAHQGYVEHRLRYIEDRLAKNKNMVWLNQYANPHNIQSHLELTAQSLLNAFSHIHYLFIGAGTSGTLMGCLKRFKEVSPQTMIIAVDAIGSINFSHQSGKRYLPGLGSSRKPEILESALVTQYILVDEKKTIAHCQKLAKQYGLLCGASTGTVLAAIEEYSTHFKQDDIIVTISPDGGIRYLDTVYSKEWLEQRGW